VFEWLFPNWTNPHVLAGLVAVRTVLDASFTVVVADALGVRSPATAVAIGVTLLSPVVMVLVLRPGGLGHSASLAELVAQLGLLAVAGYAVYVNPSSRRVVVTAALSLAALALAVVMIPIYGEATVAP